MAPSFTEYFIDLATTKYTNINECFLYKLNGRHTWIELTISIYSFVYFYTWLYVDLNMYLLNLSTCSRIICAVVCSTRDVICKLKSFGELAFACHMFFKVMLKERHFTVNSYYERKMLLKNFITINSILWEDTLYK